MQAVPLTPGFERVQAIGVTLMGLLLIGVINNGMILSQIPAFWQLVVKGSILLAAVLYDEVRRQRRDDT